jgi:di/tricarboxylate transporter
MTNDQYLILAVLLAAVAMFLWGKWRHDMVALGALLACVLAGLVPSSESFSGFGHPAVITVACVLVLSRGLQTSGAVDGLTRLVLPARAGTILSMTALIGLGALLSAFMNNVGAMALLMPIAIQISKRLKLAPGQVLMPLAFGTIFGGMTTLIGTPPNLIVSGFRSDLTGQSFSMFDFSPVGFTVAAAGVLFIVLIMWRLVPVRKQAGVEGFESGAYTTEARVSEKSKAVGMTVADIETALGETDTRIIGMVRNEVRLTAPNPHRRIYAGDILVIEADAEELAGILSELGLKLEEAGDADKQKMNDKENAEGKPEGGDTRPDDNEHKENDDDKKTGSDDIVLMELTVLPNSVLRGRSARDLLLRTRYGLNLLALSRHGKQSKKRLRSTALRAGDLLLMQGPPDAVLEFASDYGCVPLAERELRIPDKRKAFTASIIMALAIAVAAFGLLPAAVAFSIGVLFSMVFKTIPPRAVYDAVDWPVIVLLGALMPVAGAMETTGTADIIARVLMNSIAQGNAVFGLAVILIVSMFLSDLMNNAATAAVMCPIAIGTAGTLGVNPDTFLMAVAIGASCAFLTPIGHQNNTLILGPGGFRFGDFWKPGLLAEIIVVGISIPMLLWIWPL